MHGQVQRTRWSPEKGEFLLSVDSMIAAVVDAVAEELEREFAAEITSLKHLVWSKSHPEHSVLVVTPTPAAVPDQHLRCRMREAMLRHLHAVGKGRMSSWAS